MITIGKVEKVDIEEFELFDLDAKIDTGAYSCAIHCDDIRVDDEMVTFTLHDEIHPSYNGKSFTVPIHKKTLVKSSNGQSEERIVIKTKLTMGPKPLSASITLTNREKMQYPLLIGRKYLCKRFIVDVSQEYIAKSN